VRSRTLFFYGTLQFPAVLEAVTGRRLACETAVLDGYARFRVRGEVYPGIVAAAGAHVPGVICSGVDPVALARVDRFEGEMYRREPVQVRAGRDGHAVDAETYVVRPRWRGLLADAPWDPDEFARRWHDAYVREGIAERRARGTLVR
jgi:gamma-glutamylcyclotransferase (GGCT)/AIG2-like uncharacterized protein YtfP